jgi:hypothetical protein
MRFGIVPLECSPALLKKMYDDDDPYGITPTSDDQFVHEIKTNESNIKRLITAWQVAGWLYRKSRKTQLFVVNCPEGTVNEYAPKQKLPPKRPDKDNQKVVV